MKPRIIDRLLLILLMLVLMALGLGMLATSLGFVPLGILNDIVAFPYQSAQNGWITAGFSSSPQIHESTWKHLVPVL